MGAGRMVAGRIGTRGVGAVLNTRRMKLILTEEEKINYLLNNYLNLTSDF